MKSCPDCETRLTDTATRCRCGWRASDAPLKLIKCDFCEKNAIVNLNEKRVCLEHYEADAQQRAKVKCVEMGLLTPEQCRQWLRNNQLQIKKIPKKAA